MNSLNNLQREELLSLIADYCDGTIETAAGERLEVILRESESARALYVEYLDLHQALRKQGKSAGLRTGGQQVSERSPMAAAILSMKAASANTPVLGFLNRARGYAVRSSIAATLLVAAALYGTFGLTVWQMSKFEPGEAARLASSLDDESALSPIVARLVGQRHCRWGAASVSPELNATLRAGVLRLEEGEADIEFEDGARVTLYGPCRYELLSANGSFLSNGRVFARVPQPAIGFFVNTPSAEVIDLGTEFGVDVNSVGSTEVHVLRGVVETKPLLAGEPTTQNPVRLSAGEAVRIEGSTAAVTPLAADGAKFAISKHSKGDSTVVIRTYLDAVAADRPLAYWPLDEQAGARTIADCSGNGHEGTVRGAVEFGVAGPVSNPASTAARFDGASWIEIAKPEPLALTEDFTVEAWLRPEPVTEIGRVLSVDPGDWDHGWGFGWLPRKRMGNAQDGVLFTLYNVKDYRLDRQPWPTRENWHHVAIVCDRLRNVHQFVDGKWSATVEGEKRGIAGAAQVTLGRQSNGTQSYRGGVAHLAVYPRALDERQILRHFELAAAPLKDDPLTDTHQKR